MKTSSPNISITTQTKGKLPSLPFAEMAKKILGKNYELSLVFATPKTAQKLNKTYRKKSYTPNVLAFPYSIKSGELIICLSVIKNSAKDFDMTYTEFLAYLVIHGMLHLKGMEHSSTMESAEEKFCKFFNTPHYTYDATLSNRNRHRHSDNTRSDF
jgi:probable rRNA maturation factor